MACVFSLQGDRGIAGKAGSIKDTVGNFSFLVSQILQFVFACGSMRERLVTFFALVSSLVLLSSLYAILVWHGEEPAATFSWLRVKRG